uniref:Reverse transcriptase Ty1/copia-type domain-containing protein n=1 Tax=Cannabis sativa TaxID=3483 RepID=A0A803PMN1_CANSA
MTFPAHILPSKMVAKHKGYLCLHPTSGNFFVTCHVILNESSFPFAAASAFPTPPQKPHFVLTSLPFSIPATARATLVSPSTLPVAQSSPITAPTTPLPFPTPSPIHPYPSFPSTPSINASHTSSSTSSPPPTDLHDPHELPIAPTNLHPMITRAKSGIHKPRLFFNVAVGTPLEPSSFREASTNPFWNAAMDTEIVALKSQRTWVEHYKAGLVAKGFPQTHGLDYHETFSLVVKPNSIQLILSIVVSFNWVIKQLDVQNTFLYGDLTETVYMTQPEGFVDPTTFIISTTVVIVLLIYVDDIIVTGSSESSIAALLSFFNTSLHLSQTKYVRDLLAKTQLLDSKPVITPMDLTSLSLYNGEPLADATTYRSLVGALQYCTLTRRDILFTINKLCQFLHAPTSVHYQAAKRVLRYLKEYHALANGASEILWMQSLLGELGFPLTVPPTLHCDNMSTLHLASNLVLHARTNDVKIDYHFVRERVKRGLLQLRFTPSEDQVAECLTKSLVTSQF